MTSPGGGRMRSTHRSGSGTARHGKQDRKKSRKIDGEVVWGRPGNSARPQMGDCLRGLSP